MCKLKRVLSVLLVVLFTAPGFGIVLADEGMWPFNIVPRADIKQRYGFDVTDAWLKKVQLASVRFNSGGSGSFVSSDGLVLTNHHIASDTLQKISTPEKDYVKEGFYARSRAEEAKAPDLELNVLISIEDVTGRVNGAIKPGMSPADSSKARRAETAAIEKESLAATGLRSDVVALYQGGQYNLYRYKKYTDVRLVFAPEVSVAFFGGDPDNFTYPRFDLDMALFRVYEDDKPLKVENYFRWSKAGAKDGELAFVSGHPGSTARLNTVAHLEYSRDTGLPLALKRLTREREMLNRYGKLGAEQARRAQEELFSVENSLKALTGQLQGLQDESLMSRKREAEAKLRKMIATDARKQSEYGDAWDAIAKGRKDLPSYLNEFVFFEQGAGFSTDLFQIARALVRLAAENPKPNSERLPEYSDARRASLELNLYSPAPIYEDFEKFKLADSLALMKETLPDSQVVKRVLKQETPEARAAELIAGTKLANAEYRKQLAAGGWKAIQESNDSMIQIALAVDDAARAARRRYEVDVQSNERANYAKIAHALFEVEGTKLYPDATFTLRLSYGVVKGYQENGKPVAPFTTFGGFYKHAAEHNNQPPYQVPERWAQRKSAVNLSTQLNFVSTNDIIGGNSGSPVFNKNAELVGLIFDGNIQSLVGNYVYDEKQNRAVSVDSRGMLEALRNIYGAAALADELTK